MVSELNREELAWAAGFADGEAHFGLVTTNNKTQNKHIHIQICQTEDGPLERFQKALGLGKIYGPYTPKKKDNGNRRPYKQFHIDNFEHVQYAVGLLWPWLSRPKKNQITRMLKSYGEYQNKLRTNPNKSGPVPQPHKMAGCHPERFMQAKGMCNACYRQSLRSMRVSNEN